MANEALPETDLEGIKVLEYGDFITAPYCARILADLGAEVIKIETPGKGDSSRQRGPFAKDKPDPEGSLLFFPLNVNKKGVTLDPLKASGKKIFLELAKSADVLIEDRPPRLMKEAGLDYASLNAVNSGLVVISITPFGQTGPYRHYKAYPLNTFQSGGEGYLTPGATPFPERQPLKMGKFAGDYFCGTSAAGATLAALFSQQVTGQGQHIDFSKQEALLVLDAFDLLRWPNNGVSTNRSTRGYRFAGVLPCKDGYVDFAFHRWPDEWLALLEVIGSPEWAEDENLKDHVYCEEHATEIKERLALQLAGQDKESLYRKARENHCPLAPCYRIDEVANSEQMKARGFFAEVEHPQWGKFMIPTTPYKVPGTPWKLRSLAPRLGEHNAEIYCGRLGHSQQDLVKLRETGVI